MPRTDSSDFSSEHTERYKKFFPPPEIKGVFSSFISDMKSGKRRYEYLENMLRDIPGNLGLSLRYRLLTNKFEQAGEHIVIWPGVRIKHPYNMSVGDRTQLGYNTMYQASAGITIGDNALIGPGVKIWTTNHLVSNLEKNIIDQGYDCASVEIGDDCWLASNAFVTPGSRIARGCVVTPNSVIRGDYTKEYSILDGNPAKYVGKRNHLGIFKQFGGKNVESKGY